MVCGLKYNSFCLKTLTYVKNNQEYTKSMFSKLVYNVMYIKWLSLRGNVLFELVDDVLLG